MGANQELKTFHRYFLAVQFAMFISSGCTRGQNGNKLPVSDFTLKFKGEYVIPYNLQFKETTVGGLSGIDYDKQQQLFYSISDDRSHFQPARFYTYRIRISDDKIDTVVFSGVTFLQSQNRDFFPPATSQTATVDPEALRVYKDDIIWSSEGDRIISGKAPPVLLNPQIFIASRDGKYIDTFSLPPQLKMSAGNSGPRQNGSFEGLAVSTDQQNLFASVEEPLLQDGPRAGIGDSSGVVRIIKYNLETRKPVAQYAYMIDPVAHQVAPVSGYRLNGISDIMCLGNDKLLIVERSYSTGRLSLTIKVYIADLSKADDISAIQSLQGKSYKVAPKKLVFNTDDLGIFIDNIEGVTFGPTLSSGNQSLIFIADNNFNFFEKSQLLLFEVE